MFEILEHNFNNLVKIYQSYLLPEYLGNTIYKALNYKKNLPPSSL
jgi:hypothetical protein